MRRFLLLSALAALLTVPGQAQAQGSKVKWSANLASAKSQAARANRLIMVDFYTDWCSYCKKLDAETYTDASVGSLLNSQYVSLKLNAEKDGRGLAQRFGVSSFPTILFMDSGGGEAGRIAGFLPPKEFKAEVGRIQQRHQEYLKLRGQYRAGSVTPNVAARYATALAGRGEVSAAYDVLEKVTRTSPKHPEVMGAHVDLGFAYLNKQQSAQALACFKRALSSASPQHRAAARMGTAACYLSTNNRSGAIKELEAVLAMKDAPAHIKARAKEFLPRLKKGG